MAERERVLAILAALTVLITSCGSSATKTYVQPTPSGAEIKIFVPGGRSGVTATDVVIVDAANQQIATGQVTSVGDSNGTESVIFVAVNGHPTLYADATAIVCHNVIRVRAGSTVPTSALVIPLVRSVVRPGNC